MIAPQRRPSAPPACGGSREGRITAGEFHRKGRNIQNGVLCGDDQPLHQVFQLTDIARPRVLLQKRHEPGTEGQLLAVLPAKALQKLMSQRQDVLRPLPQGRDVNADDIQPVKEVGAEQAPLHLLLQIAVRGYQQPEIQLNAPGAGQPLNGLFLNELQELGLDMVRQLTDLVQNSVPWLASSILPILPPEAAPVNAPFS